MVQLPMVTRTVDIGLEPSVRYAAYPTMLKHKGRKEHQVLTYGGSAQNLVYGTPHCRIKPRPSHVGWPWDLVRDR